MQTETSDFFRDRLRRDPKVIAALAATRSAQNKFTDLLDALHSELHPEIKLETLKLALQRLEVPKEISRTRQLIAEWSGPGGIAARDQARSVIRKAHGALASTIGPLLDACDSVLLAVGAEIEKAEAEFHLRFGVPTESTAVTRKLFAVRALLRPHREFLAPSRAGSLVPPNKKAFVGLVEFLR